MNNKNKMKAIVAFAVAVAFVMPVAAFANIGITESGYKDNNISVTSGNSPINVDDRDELEIDENIVMEFSFQKLETEKVTINGRVFDRVKMADLPNSGDTGKPCLPVKSVNILLPQKSTLDSVDIVYGDKTSLGYGFNVERGQKPISLDRETFAAINVEKGDESFEYYDEIMAQSEAHPILRDAFDLSQPFPIEYYSAVGIYGFRGYSILVLNLYPVHYVDKTGEIYYYNSMHVTVKTKDDQVNPLFRDLPQDAARVKEMVVNPSMATTYKSKAWLSLHSSLVDSSESYDYVIITSQQLKNSPGAYTFQDLVDLKTRKGLDATIVTIEDIADEPAYWNTTSTMFNDTQAQIRSFIQDAYLNWGTEYILLGADGDGNKYTGECILPARNLRDRRENIPSDLYYCCLDGNYNSNENGAWGEPTDGISGGDVDLIAEVYVGRAPVDSGEEVSNFVWKTIAYEYSSGSYLDQVLLVGEKLEIWGPTWGGDYKDEIIDGSSANGYTTVGIPSSDYTIMCLYDKSGDWSGSDVVNAINNGVHIVNHIGHSEYDEVMKMKIGDVDRLTNDEYCFIYSQGCGAGGFDEDDSIGEHFITSPHGAFATIMNTRSGWYMPYSTNGTSQCYDREFFDAVYGEGIRELGRANQDSKEDNIWCINEGVFRWCYYTITLLGDPEVSFKEPSALEHDVAVRDLDAPTYVVPDEIFRVNVAIANYGTSSESDVLVKLTIDGVTEDSIIIGSLGSGGETVLTFGCSLSTGIHRVGVDVQSVYGENFVFNNVMERQVISGPDVAVTDVEYPTPPLYVGNSVNVKATVKNFGMGDLYDLSLSLKVGGVVVDSTTIPSLSAGASTFVALSWTPSVCKWYTITAVVDPVAGEAFVGNNRFDTAIFIVDHTAYVYVDDDGDKDFVMISDAVYWVGNGDTIYVYSGVYYDSVFVDKDMLSIVGEDDGNTIIDGSGAADVIRVKKGVNGVTIANLTIRNRATPLLAVAGLMRGINIEDSSGCSIINCTLCDISGNAIQIWGYPGCSNINIIDCEIYNNLRGIWLEYDRHSTLKRNVMYNNTYSFCHWMIYDAGYSDHDYSSNTINGRPLLWLYNQNNIVIDETDNPGYIALFSCSDVTVKNLDLYGLMLVGTSNSTISNVSCHNGCFGFCLSMQSSHNTFIDCETYNNDDNGMYVRDSSYNNFRNCKFHDNPGPGGFSIYNFFVSGVYSSSDSHYNEYTDCEFYNNEEGYCCQWGGGSDTLINCTAHHNYAVNGGFINGNVFWPGPLTGITLINCTSHSNQGSGIAVQAQSNGYTKIIGCICYNHTDPDYPLDYAHGIAIITESRAKIINSTCYNNLMSGINFETRFGAIGSDSTITGCTLYDNTRGVYIENSYDNLIYNNYFNNIDNAIANNYNVWNIAKTAGTNIIGGSYLGGNYWSDYEGEDTDGDGLGDTMLPYNSNGYIMHPDSGDWLPLVPVLDTTPPEIIDNTPSSATPGRPFTFSADVTDNVFVSDAYVEYWFGDGSHTNVSMNPISGDTWEKQITIGHTLLTLHYIISAVDISDNWNNTGVKDVTVVDDENPEIKNVQATPPYQTHAGYVNISAEVTDNLEVDEVYLHITDPSSNEENFSIAQNKTGDTYYCNRTYTALGVYHYFIWANDTSGNEATSSTKTFGIGTDTTPPVTMHDFDGTLGENGWFVSDVVVTLDATDDLSGVEETRYSLDSGTWQVYADPFTVTADGLHTVEYYSVDFAGNEEDVKGPFDFKIDQTVPTINLTVDKTGLIKWLLTANVSDETSGVAKVEFYLNGKLLGEVTTSPYEWECSKKGTAYAIVYDNAGNDATSDEVPVSKGVSQSQSSGLTPVQMQPRSTTSNLEATIDSEVEDRIDTDAVTNIKPSEATVDPELNLDVGRVWLRGLLFRCNRVGNDNHAFAIRLHYIELTPFDRESGMVTMNRVIFGDLAYLGRMYEFRFGLFTYVIGLFEGGLEII